MLCPLIPYEDVQFENYALLLIVSKNLKLFKDNRNTLHEKLPRRIEQHHVILAFFYIVSYWNIITLSYFTFAAKIGMDTVGNWFLHNSNHNFQSHFLDSPFSAFLNMLRKALKKKIDEKVQWEIRNFQHTGEILRFSLISRSFHIEYIEI